MITDTTHPITDFQCPNLHLFKEGKVRKVYDLDDKLLLVATDRISAFDYILKDGIPRKGEVLTKLSKFWFDFLKMPHHCISIQTEDYPSEAKEYIQILEGRSMLVKKTKLIPIECVVRGYLAGSGWKDYQQTGAICGNSLPKGLQLADKLPTPIFTPAFKAESGHDENISIDKMRELIGDELTSILQKRSLDIYEKAYKYADEKGIIIADTKFEFGEIENGVLLIDEVLTPDSSRFWPKEKYEVGISPPSFDKQIVRDYLETTDWDKNSPPPTLPESIRKKTSKEYQKIYTLLTGSAL